MTFLSKEWVEAVFGPERMELRRALKDACDTCHVCGGHGKIAIPAGWMTCSRCGPWRKLLRRQ
jgi:hypothetical protein